MGAGLHAVDILVLVVYLTSVVFVGVFSQRGGVRVLKGFRRQILRFFGRTGGGSRGEGDDVDAGGSDIENFFLGNRQLPWWALAASGIASNIDVSGTAINAAMIYSFGVRGLYIEFRGGVTLSLAIFLVFGKWTRRSGVMTVAEWMVQRFGKGKGGHAARAISSVASLVQTVLFITYFCIGAGKFVSEFLDLPEQILGLPGQFWASLMLTSLSMIYTVTSGLEGVVWTDVYQGVLIFIAVVIVVAMSFVRSSFLGGGDSVTVSIPDGNGSFIPRTMSWTSFSSPLPKWTDNVPEQSPYSDFNPFGMVVMFSLLKALMEGVGGPTSYTAQRYLSVESDRSAGTMSLLWILLLSLRWPFIMAIVMLGLTYNYENPEDPIQDPEQVMARVMNEFLPVGVKGFVVSGLIAAAMSTFDSTVNSGAAYWVKDIFQAYIRPEASPTTLIWHGRAASIAIVACGLSLTLVITSINAVWSFINMSIGGGMVIPLILRWLWWRFNGWGFAVGTPVGMAVSPLLGGLLDAYTGFVGGCLASLIACVIASLVTQPVDMPTLARFYRNTRPAGLWGPVRASIREADARDAIPRAPVICSADRENKRDAITASLISWPFQVLLFLAWMTALTKDLLNFVTTTGFLALFAAALWANWYRYLPSPKGQPVGNSSREEALADYGADATELQPVVVSLDHDGDSTSFDSGEEITIGSTSSG